MNVPPAVDTLSVAQRSRFLGSLVLDRENSRANFDESVRHQIEMLVSERTPPIRYDDLLEHLDGIFPAELDHQLRLLGIEAERTSQLPSDAPSKPGGILPIEHPANYDWRFTQETGCEIAKLALHFMPSLGPARGIACLGTPTVAAQTVLRKSGTSVRLLDVNEPLIAMLRGAATDDQNFDAIAYDAQYAIAVEFQGSANVVVMDPPWYLDYFELFFSRAGELLGPSGGVIMSTVFPQYSRHSARRDLIQLDGLLGQWGCIKSTEVLTARFSMPRFERLVLNRQQATIPQRHWRKAPVFAFHFDEDHRLPRLGSRRLEKADWIRFGDPNISIVLNSAVAVDSSATLNLSRVKQESISRHDQPAKPIFLWTSDHEFYVGNTQ